MVLQADEAEPMRCALTGAAGLLGASVAIRLSEHGNVTTIGR